MPTIKLLIVLLVAGLSLQQCTTILGCLECADNPTVCTKCNNGVMYFMQNGNCVVFSGDDECRRINEAGTCILCSALHHLDAANKCVPVVPVANCLVYDNGGQTTTCLICKVGYSLTGPNQCSIQVPFCQSYSQDGSACSTCVPGFRSYDLGGHCVPVNNDAQCSQIDTMTGACQVCASGSNLIMGVCRPILQNCLCADASSLYCETCAQGHYPNSQGQCTAQSQPNCATYNPNTNICSKCMYGYFPLGGNCIAQSLSNCGLFFPTPTFASSVKTATI